jgi:hypothetical protein
LCIIDVARFKHVRTVGTAVSWQILQCHLNGKSRSSTTENGSRCSKVGERSR